MGKGIRATAAVIAAWGLVAPAQAGGLDGTWVGPVGRVRLALQGDEVVGVLVEDSPVCAYRAGSTVLRGRLAMGNLAGKVRLCALCGAKTRDHWAFAMMVQEGGRLAGAAHVSAAGCEVPGRSDRGGVRFDREAPQVADASLPREEGAPTGKVRRPGKSGEGGAPKVRQPGATGADGAATESVRLPGPKAAPGSYDPRGAADRRQRAMNVARDGMQFLEEGRFEAARGRFEAAVAIDPGYAEGYNGIGVTHAMRRDWKEATLWYQRSIAADPDIGDAYYNLACAYAQTGQASLAVRFLRLAVLNGYSQISHLREDSDLAPLRGRKDYQQVLALGELGSQPARP